MFGSGCQCGGTCGVNKGNAGIDVKDRSYYLEDIGVKPLNPLTKYSPTNAFSGVTSYTIRTTLELPRDSFVNGEVYRLLNDGIEGEKRLNKILNQSQR